MTLIEPTASLVFGPGGDMAIHRETHFSAEFLDSLQSERLAKAHVTAGEIDRVASVPTHLVDLWLAQGFDFWRADAREIVQRLQKNGLDAFITTTKAV